MKINNRKELNAAILELERKRKEQEELLVSQFHTTYESLKPGNILKQGFKNVINSPGFPEKIIKSLTGLGVGILTKKLFIGKPTSLISRLLGTAVNLSVAKTTVGNADKIKAYAIATYNNLFKKKTTAGSNHVPKLKIF